MKLSIVHKLSLMTVFLVLVTAGVVGGIFFTKTTDLLVEHAHMDIAEEIGAASHRLQTHIESQNEDVLYIANTPPTQGILRAQKNNNYDELDKSTHQQWVERLQTLFTAMLESKPTYLKLRYIDKQGQELVVVGRENGQIIVSSDEQLQNKAHRVYARETLKLPLGAVYLSEIDLNREYGKISIPHLEVLRSATPVYDKQDGTIGGFLLLTVDISHELRGIQEVIQNAHRKVYITNDKGEYLLHPDSSKTYGFDLGNDFRIQKDIPRLAELFSLHNKDTRLTLRPEDTDGENVVSFAKIPFDPAHPERFIAVSITQLYSDIVARQSDVMNEVLLLALALAAMVTVLAILFAYRLSRPIKQITQVMDDYTHHRKTKATMPISQKDEVGVLARSYQALIKQVDKAQTDLLKMNSNLEALVIERTHKLEMSEIYQRSIVENMVDALITIDKKGLITSFNPAAVRIFGYNPEEVIGQNVKILMPEPYYSSHDSFLKNYNRTGEKKIIGMSREVDGRRKDGTIFPMDLGVSEMLVNDQKIYAGVVRDITERKQMDKMKNEFISTVSHELRTPLTSIRGSLGLISGGAVGDLPAQADEMLKIATNNTERLLLLINDILDIQKIESGQMAFKFQKLEVMPFLKKALADNAAYGEQHGVMFRIVKRLENAYVYADKDRLMQVMANLLSNAAKFSPDNESVEINVAYHNDDSLRISVTDHGPGIPVEFQSKLFDKFTQSDSSDARQKGGTGLGLNISRAIIEKHGGRIDFISRKNIGTTFFIELPGLMGNMAVAEEPTQKKLTGQQQQSILIVEDDADVAALMQRMLAESGFDSDIAYDAQEARQLLIKKPTQYKAITLDLILPGEDGMSLLQDLHQEAATHDIPVVVVSVKADETKQGLTGGAVGVVDWLNKPIEQNRLIKAVKKAAGPSFKPRILHVEDEEDVHKVIKTMLGDFCHLNWATNITDAKDVLEAESFDLVLLDIGLPDGSGLDLLEVIERRVIPPRVVIFTAYDIAEEYAQKVSAVLVKSRTNNFKLVEIIKEIIKNNEK